MTIDRESIALLIKWDVVPDGPQSVCTTRFQSFIGSIRIAFPGRTQSRRRVHRGKTMSLIVGKITNLLRRRIQFEMRLIAYSNVSISLAEEYRRLVREMITCRAM
jgi:hypothetical protein